MPKRKHTAKTVILATVCVLIGGAIGVAAINLLNEEKLQVKQRSSRWQSWRS